MASNTLPLKTLIDKVALVTGAGRGIGYGIALELGQRGAKVAVNYGSSREGADKLVKEIEAAGSQAIAIQADISKTPEVKRLFKAAIDHFGRLDIVCSNAGKEVFSPEEEVTEQLYDDVFALNTRAQFFVAQQAYINLQHGGRIILMSSVAATMSGVPNHALYAGSKAAVEGFTRSFAKDCGHKRITVNAIAPGGVKSDMFQQ
jgi:3-oxoacyl-[acyl-carrier protein] reductase